MRGTGGGSPTFSVIVPAYQAEATLERAVRSVLRQSYADLEVLVVDDGSTDRTRAVARALSAQDSRVHVLPADRNQGVSSALNRGLDAARGTWVALLGADDAWLPRRLERLLAESHGVDIVADDVLMLGAQALDRGEVAGVRVVPWLGVRLDEPRLIGLEEFVEHDLGYLKPAMRRQAMRDHGLRYWPDLRVAEDFAIAVVALAHGLTWRQLPEAHYCYLRGEPSLSSGPTRIAEQQVVMLPWLLAVPEISASPQAVRVLRRHTCRAHATLAYQQVRLLARERAVGRLGAFLVTRPEAPGLLVRKTARRGWLIARRRLLHADRLPQHSIEAVRQAFGLEATAPGT
jgi:hypothetical protein